MKKTCLFIFSTLAITASIHAAGVILAWDPNQEPDIAKYTIYYGPTGSTMTTYDVSVTQAVITGLQQGVTYVFYVTATNSSGLESGPSNTVNYFVPYFDSNYTSSSTLVIDRNTGVIYGSVVELPADPKSVYWSKGGLSVASGQVLSLDATMLYSGTATAAPISICLIDDNTRIWLSAERVIYVDGSSSSYGADLVVNGSSAAASLRVFCGLSAGTYEFEEITTALTTPTIAPVYNLYLRQLLPKQVVGLCSAEWVWDPVPGSQGYVVRTALFREEIEKGASGNLLDQQLLPASQTAYRCDISATLYGGIYVAVSSIAGGQESVPYITWYLPGDIYNTADEEIPPLCLEGSVDAVDVNYAYAGYRTARRVPALTPGQPAGREERTDVDNNTYAGRVSDYSFIRSQNLKRQRMR